MGSDWSLMDMEFPFRVMEEVLELNNGDVCTIS